jgi:putative salt-induced outer membrane protein YdiY
MHMRSIRAAGGLVCLVFPLLPASASADAPAPMGTPPPEATAVVEAPQAAPAPPKIPAPARETTATASAGGLLSTGNSQLIAATVNSKVDLRRGRNGFGASVIGNYGQGAPAGQDVHVTTQNVQSRLRYDRYLADTFSAFLIATVRHDRFQGLNVRFNLDPGFKYLFVNDDVTKFWSELGYDFQYDIRRDDALGTPPALLDKTATDHSARVFVGFNHSFNKEVTFSTGVEYLQSFVDSTKYRINYDALFAASVGAGFSFGAGFTLRYDHAPLPGKKDVDTATTLSLIYSFSEIPAAASAPH